MSCAEITLLELPFAAARPVSRAIFQVESNPVAVKGDLAEWK
jgi:hypothetical protein